MGAADAFVASFDPEIAQMQWFFMSHILSDEATKTIKIQDH